MEGGDPGEPQQYDLSPRRQKGAAMFDYATQREGQQNRKAKTPADRVQFKWRDLSSDRSPSNEVSRPEQGCRNERS
jgi:hypothetical protein